MKLKNIVIIAFIATLVFFPSCKKKGHAILSITIDNYVVEYKFWSASYDITWTETAGYGCNIFQDALSIVDGNGNDLYSYSLPLSIPVAANSTDSKYRSGILIGPYALSLYTKPVKLRHTLSYTDTGSGDTYTVSADIVIHE